MICKNCGANDEDAMVCPNCGADICSHCAEAPDRICPYCYSTLEYKA